jgi:hypothetical protein
MLRDLYIQDVSNRLCQIPCVQGVKVIKKVPMNVGLQMTFECVMNKCVH